MVRRPTYFYLAIIIVSICLGGIIGWFSRIQYMTFQPGRMVEIREDNTKYHFIHPLLLVDIPREAPEYLALKKAVGDYVNSAKSQGDATSISVYFRHVNSGKWTGINVAELYDPSSMLKVAIMIGYLKKAEDDPSILLKQLPYVANNDAGQYYKPVHPLLSGTYTVQNLIEAMIVNSDNDALTALYNNNEQVFVDVLQNLKIPPPPTTTALDFMSPQTYSTIFRTLYSSTYLSRGVSEQALQLLTQTTFKNGLVAGVPPGITVAHKFGEHTYTSALTSQPVSRQLHDCGIVYYPSDPYLLCIMTRGKDFDKLEQVISTASRIVYQQVSSSDPNKTKN